MLRMAHSCMCMRLLWHGDVLWVIVKRIQYNIRIDEGIIKGWFVYLDADLNLMLLVDYLGLYLTFLHSA